MYFNLNSPLIKFDERETASISFKDGFSGILITGATGSGKSSASARYIALQLLNNAYGGLVLCVKSEIDTWREYCRLTGRENDLLVLQPGGEHAFNFLEYESQRSDATFVSNLASLLHNVIEANKQKKQSGSDDRFWQDSLTLLIHNCISLCMLSSGLGTGRCAATCD